MKLDYANEHLVLLVKSRGLEWIHAALVAIALVITWWMLAAHQFGWLLFLLAVVGYTAFDLYSRFDDETAFWVDTARSRLLVRHRSLGRVVDVSEYDLRTLIQFGVETRDRWGKRIVAEFDSGERLPLETRYGDAIDQAVLVAANTRLQQLKEEAAKK